MSATAPSGFVAWGVACGIKESGDLDLALVATDDGKPVPAAGVFTDNLATAAPVTVSRDHLISTGGHCAAVVLSSGNANAATGKRGLEDAKRICSLVGGGLGVSPSQVLICQTGLIGIPLPMSKVETGIEALLSGRSAGERASQRAATAMMTTDTLRKEILVERHGFKVGGMAKGAAMLAPRMSPPAVSAARHATMLAVLTTDASCSPETLSECLASAVESTFNRMTVDGCTSTNDTVLALASGRSRTAPERGQIEDALTEACAALASMMVGDAEGGTKVAKVVVTGAASETDALLAARKVTESSLVKCSLNGEDPYWGRIVSELGSSGAIFDLARVSVSYGGIVVCRGGTAADHDAEAVAAHMKQHSIEIVCDLDIDSCSAAVQTCDLGYGYIDENRTTS